jgi:MFS family permease
VPTTSRSVSASATVQILTTSKVVLFAAFGSLFTGYSLAIIVQTVGQPTWYKSLHLEPVTTAPGYSHTTSIIGASNGVFFAGGTIGCLLGGWLGDRLGRVNGFRVAAIVGIIGAAIQTGAVNQAMASQRSALLNFILNYGSG